MDLHTPEPAGGPQLVLGRRRLLTLVAGAGAGVALAACSSSASHGSATTAATTPATTAATAPATTATTAVSGTTPAVTEVVPEETAGPFPGDGSNGPDVLTQAGVVRSDIRTSFGAYSGTSAGVPLTLTMTVLDSSAGFTPLRGAAVYIWHADQDGQYSLYGVTDQNYLRGVQETDADGRVTFVTNVPSCYSGRWPHIHFEVYPSIDAATSGGRVLATSQMAVPEDVCAAAFATAGYTTSARNLSQVSLATDMVFRDGTELETPTFSGDATSGYVAVYTCAV